MTATGTRAYRISRWLVIRTLAFALRHGVSDADALDALRRAFRHRAADVQWRLAIVDEASRHNARRYWRNEGER